MRSLFEDRNRGEGVAGQEKFLDLSVAVGELNVAECPPGTQDVYVVKRAASNEYLFSGSNRDELPLAWAYLSFRRT
jgi:hypothetical protein